jgi:flavodoxin I
LKKKKELTMKRVGLFFGTITGNTKEVAETIRRELEAKNDTVVTGDISDAADISPNDFDLMILGASTWNIGELDEWEEFIANLGPLATTNTKFALFGLGDQDEYPHKFQDSLGALYDRLREKGATVIGSTPTAGYNFIGSGAVIDGQFIGLALDNDSQPDRTPERISNWIDRIESQV